jgi:hypothetical protein
MTTESRENLSGAFSAEAVRTDAAASRGIVRSWREGVRRVHSAPAIVFGVWTLSLLLALPLGLVLRALIRDSLGDSLAGGTAATGVNYDWWNEFLQQTGGIGATFVPSIIGFAAPLKNLSDLADNEPLAATVAALVVVWLVLWAFLAGGIFDRYARGRTTHTPAFFAACGVFFFRFLRLGAVAWLAYWLLFRYVHGWLFVTLWRGWTEDLASEREAFWIRLALYALFAILLAAINLVVDYAKVRAVVEDRRSMIGALLASGRFIVRHPRATLGLYVLNVLVFVLILAVYRAVAPGASWSGAGVWFAFLVTQVYIVARLWAKLVFAASQIDLFQRRLAHARFAAFPETAQLEPPVVETIGPPAVPPPIQP